MLIFPYPSYVLGAQKNNLIETVLLSIHNICFGWEIRNLIFWYTLLTKVLFRWWHHFLFLDNIEKFKKNSSQKFWILLKILWKMEHLLQKSKCSIFQNIMENGAFAPKEQMLHLPLYFKIHDISKALLWRKGLTLCMLIVWLSAGFFQNYLIKKNLPGTLSQCQTVRNQIRTDIFWSWSGSKLFAKVINRQQKWPQQGKLKHANKESLVPCVVTEGAFIYSSKLKQMKWESGTILQEYSC